MHIFNSFSASPSISELFLTSVDILFSVGTLKKLKKKKYDKYSMFHRFIKAIN